MTWVPAVTDPIRDLVAGHCLLGRLVDLDPRVFATVSLSCADTEFPSGSIPTTLTVFTTFKEVVTVATGPIVAWQV